MILTFSSLQSSGKSVLAFLFAQYLSTDRPKGVTLYDFSDKKNLRRLYDVQGNNRSSRFKIEAIDDMSDVQGCGSFHDLLEKEREQHVHIFDTASVLHPSYVELLYFSTAIIVPYQLQSEYKHDTEMYEQMRKYLKIQTPVIYLPTNFDDKQTDDLELSAPMRKHGAVLKSPVLRSPFVTHKHLAIPDMHPNCTALVKDAFDELKQHLNL